MMKIFISFVLLLMLSACGLPSVNVNPNMRNVDCDKFTSRGNGENKSLNIVTTDGRSLSVVAIGSARSPQKINFQYGKRCYIDLLRDVKSIERIDDRSQKVVLENGKVIKIGTYDIRLQGVEAMSTPYNKSPWSILVATKNGGIEYYSDKVEPFRDIAKLSVLNQPVNQSYLKALADLKLKEDAAYEAEKRKNAYVLEQQIIKREEERKAERERLEQKAELARSERQKRDGSKMTISKQADSQDADKLRDSEGREIIRGPVGSGQYNKVHIISDTIGIDGDSVTVNNSVIEAPICIRTSGIGARITDNLLFCNLCIQFTGRSLVGNDLINNRCSGQGTNRPDVFGW